MLTLNEQLRRLENHNDLAVRTLVETVLILQDDFDLAQSGEDFSENSLLETFREEFLGVRLPLAMPSVKKIDQLPSLITSYK